MKLTILLLSVSLAIFSSCSTSYKTGQTPDDVYFSPTRPQDEYVRNDREDEDRPSRYNDEYYEDRYLRMKVRNHTRWSDLDDWYYSDYRNRYNVYVGCCFCSSPWTPYSHWNQYYNPYYRNTVIYKNTKPVYSAPRNYDLSSYGGKNVQTRSSGYNGYQSNGHGNSNSYSAPRNSSSTKTKSGSVLRNIFSGSSSSGSSSNSSSSGNNSSSNSNSSSSGSKAPVRRF